MIKISSDDDSWDGIYQTDLDKQVSKRRRKLLSKIIEDVNKMSAQHERVLDEMSKVEKLRMDQDLFLKWETLETVERKKIMETTEESVGYKTTTKTVEVRLDKIKSKICQKISKM